MLVLLCYSINYEINNKMKVSNEGNFTNNFEINIDKIDNNNIMSLHNLRIRKQ